METLKRISGKFPRNTAKWICTRKLLFWKTLFSICGRKANVESIIACCQRESCFIHATSVSSTRILFVNANPVPSMRTCLSTRILFHQREPCLSTRILFHQHDPVCQRESCSINAHPVCRREPCVDDANHAVHSNKVESAGYISSENTPHNPCIFFLSTRVCLTW